LPPAPQSTPALPGRTEAVVPNGRRDFLKLKKMGHFNTMMTSFQINVIEDDPKSYINIQLLISTTFPKKHV